MKKLTAVIMILTLTLSLCNSLSIASEIQTVNDTIPNEDALKTEENEKVEENIYEDLIKKTDISKDDIMTFVFDYIEDTVNEKNDIQNGREYFVDWCAGSLTTFAYYNRSRTQISNEIYKEAILKKTKQLYSMLVDNGVSITENWEDYRKDYNNTLTSPEQIKQYVNIKVGGGTEKTYSFEILNDIATVNFPEAEYEELRVQRFKIKNPQEFVDFLADMSDVFALESQNNDKKYPNEETVEELLIDFKLTDENSYGLFYEFGEIGETINCILKRTICYDEKAKSEKVSLTVNGSKKSDTFSNYFSGKYNFNYNNPIELRWETQGREIIVELDARGNDETLTSAFLDLSYTATNPSCGFYRLSVYDDNVEYREYTNEMIVEYLKESTMHGIYTRDPDAELEKKKERRQLGIPLKAFKVNALAQTMLEIDKETAPQWYKDLGRNVSLMILSVTREENFGRETAPMLRFRGSSGEIWFYYTSRKSFYQGREIEFTWGSIVSFDALKTDEDHTIEEVLTGKSICTGGENSVFESYEINVGEETYKFGVSDLNIIGCDEITQDLIYDKDYYYDDDYWDGLDDFMSNMKYGNVYHY